MQHPPNPRVSSPQRTALEAVRDGWHGHGAPAWRNPRTRNRLEAQGLIEFARRGLMSGFRITPAGRAFLAAVPHPIGERT